MARRMEMRSCMERMKGSCSNEWSCALTGRAMHDTGCPQCARMKSDEEDDFAMMLSREFPDSRIERNVRMLKVKLPDGSSSTWEVDFIIADMYAIEFNGEYWHSDKMIIPNHNITALSYHTMKHDAIINAGMVPLFARKDDWLNHHMRLLMIEILFLHCSCCCHHCFHVQDIMIAWLKYMMILPRRRMRMNCSAAVHPVIPAVSCRLLSF